MLTRLSIGQPFLFNETQLAGYRKRVLRKEESCSMFLCGPMLNQQVPRICICYPHSSIEGLPVIPQSFLVMRPHQACFGDRYLPVFCRPVIELVGELQRLTIHQVLVHGCRLQLNTEDRLLFQSHLLSAGFEPGNLLPFSGDGLQLLCFLFLIPVLPI